VVNNKQKQDCAILGLIRRKFKKRQWVFAAEKARKENKVVMMQPDGSFS
jgi:hypothetical protein